MKYKSFFICTAMFFMAVVGLSAAPSIKASAISGHPGTYGPGDEVVFTLTFENTTRAVAAGENVTPAEATAANEANTAKSLTITGFLVGSDIYGNAVEVPVSTSGGNQIAPESTLEIEGKVTIPNDGTFFNMDPGYSILLSYTYTHTPLGGSPTDVGPVEVASTAGILVDVPANLQIVNLEHPVKTFRGGDIIEMSVSILNQAPVGSDTVVRPLTSLEDFRTELYLTDDASVDRGNDFRLGFFTVFGDLAGRLNGSDQVRVVAVDGTPDPLADWTRDYKPQPDDGFLDIGEIITVTLEVLIPTNYTGTFFAAAYTDSLGEIVELEEDVDASFGDQGDNVWVDSLTPLVRIASVTSPTTLPVSEVSDGNGGMIAASDGVSDNPSVSEDGKLIVFQSTATNLDPNFQGTGNTNIYMRNLDTEEVTLISRSSAGHIANRDSFNPVISANGRYVAYESLATNLVAGAQGAGSQIYVYDVALGRTDRVSIDANGLAANGSCYTPSISEDGRFIVFESLATSLDSDYRAVLASAYATQVFVHDRDPQNTGVFDGAHTTHLISVASGNPSNEDAVTPKISLDGRVVVFASRATNLGVSNNGYRSQIWSRELGPDGVPLGGISLVSVNTIGTAGNGNSSEPAINGGPTTSPYGLQIAFASDANDLIAEDNNGISDIFVRDYSNPAAPSTVRVSVSNPRVAYGTIEFFGDINPDNTPLNQPQFGDTVTLDDGVNAPTTFTFGVDVAIGGNTSRTRNNLVSAINNASNLDIVAFATDPASGNPFVPFDGHSPSIQLFNLATGEQGNQSIQSTSSVLFVSGMSGGGTETGVPSGDHPGGLVWGSLQPSLDRSGRMVAFRSLTGGISVIRNGARVYKPDSVTEGSPRVGEIIRPINPNSSNVYVRDRDLTETGILDQEDNSDTTRASVNKFGYRTNQLLNTADSASSRMPALSANGRFIAFASDATNTGGLRFGRTNTQPLDSNNLRDVFVYDRNIVVPTIPEVENPPFVAITNPSDGDTVALTSPFYVNAGALGYNTSTRVFDTTSIASVDFYVNGVKVKTVTSSPFSTLVEPQSLDSLRIFAVATDTRGETTTSSAITVDVAATPYESPLVTIEASGVHNGDGFSVGDIITLEGKIRATANSFDFLQNFTLARFDIYVNGVSVFTSTDSSGTYSFDYETNLAGDITVNAAAVYRNRIANDDFIVENVFSETLTVNVAAFDPGNRDVDFITDSFERLFGRVPTDNEKEDGLSKLDGSLGSRAAYVAELLQSNAAETSEVAMLIYRTMTGEWPDGDELEQALDDLLAGGTGISDPNLLTMALVPEYEIRFSALNTELGFVRQLFKNKHGAAPGALSEVRLYNSAIGQDQLFGANQVIPGYSGDTVSYATQFALDNDVSGYQGPSGLPLSSLHLYAMPNDPTADLKLALTLAAFLNVNPTDQLIASYAGMTFVDALEEILADYLGITDGSNMPAALAGAQSTGGDWYASSWLGAFAVNATYPDDWVFTSDFGWIYVSPLGTSNGTWLYSSKLGTWLWGGSNLNGFFYRADQATWIWVSSNPNGTGAWIYTVNAGNWQFIKP